MVAAECMRLGLQRCEGDDRQRALFLVPTRDLVEQQARAVRGWCTELRVAEYMSTLAPPDAFDVLCDPQPEDRPATVLRRLYDASGQMLGGLQT